jgi:hypothetical protein
MVCVDGAKLENGLPLTHSVYGIVRYCTVLYGIVDAYRACFVNNV